MAPTMVFDRSSGKLMLVVGSPGGAYIINYVAKTLVGALDWRMDVQHAISLPNFGSRNGPTELERGRFSGDLIKFLKQKDHQIRLEQTSGLQAIMRVHRNGEDIWFGGADPRREGVARGD